MAGTAYTKKTLDAPAPVVTKDLSKEKGITTTVEEITPELAKFYMTKNNPNQRKIKSSVLRSYIDDIRKGHWELNGEPIIFSKSGLLMDGQHRLMAIIHSGIPALILVVRGVDDTNKIYDVGAKRTDADRSRIEETDLPSCALAASKALVGLFSVVGTGVETKYHCDHAGELRRAYNACCQGMIGRTAQKTSCVLASYLMLRTKKLLFHELDMFFQIFNSNSATPAGTEHVASPALTARKMFDAMEEIRVRRTRTQLEILIRAMEDFASGTERTIAYSLDADEHWLKYANTVRAEDGLDA